nr:exosortase O [Thermostichus vulcanus]
MRPEPGIPEPEESGIPSTPIKSWLVPGVLTASWLVIHWGSLTEWLGELGSRLSLILWLLAGLGWVILWAGAKPKGLRLEPVCHWGSLGMLLAAGVVPYVGGSLPESIGQSLQLSWGLYGLLGLGLPGSLWWRGLPFALGISVLLPFGGAFGNGLGFPARLVTAQVVEQLLKARGVAAISSHDIILLENGIAHVDLPCSGLKGLWVGGCFLLGATWLEGRRMGWLWLGVASFTLVALMMANILRVWALVEVGYGLAQPQLAELLHVPLGVLGFVGACGLSWLALQWVPAGEIAPSENGPRSTASPKSAPWGVWLVLPLLWLGSLRLPPSVGIPQALDLHALQMGSLTWVTTPLDLTAAEQDFFRPQAGTTVVKTHFDTGTVQGSLLLVGSSSWRQHHAPELCWAASGLRVVKMIPVELNPALKARWLTLEQGIPGSAVTSSGFYWFQSAQGTTDNLLSRIGAELQGAIQKTDPRWVLVSGVLEGSYSPNEPEIQSLALQLQTALESVF